MFPPLFLFSEKNLHLLHQISLQKMKKKKIGYTSFYWLHLWSSVMLVDPEVGDHSMLNLYNKSDPLSQIQKLWGFLQNFFFADIFSGYLHVFAKKSRIWCFTDVVKVTNHTGLCDTELTRFASISWSTAFESTVLGLPDYLIIQFLAT